MINSNSFKVKASYLLLFSLICITSFLISGFSILDDRSQDYQRSLVNSNLSPQSNNQYDGIPGSHSMTTDGHFLESFEGVTFPPTGWTKISPDGGTGWNRQTAGTSPVPGWGGGVITTPPGGETGTAFCTWTTGGATSNDQWLVTPQIMNVQSDDSLKFWLRYWPNSFRDSIEVLISTTTPVVGSFTTLVWRKNFAVASLDTGWIKYGFRLGNHVTAGSNIYIAFREVVADNFNDGASFSLDLVEVTSGSPPQLSGDYTIGVALFNSLTGNNLTFEKRTRTVTKQEYQNEGYLYPDKMEKGLDSEVDISNDVLITYTYEEEYYVPIQNGQEYTGELYHKFTDQERTMYNLQGAGVYTTITAAMNDAVLKGVSGPVRFLMLDATYPSETYPILVGTISGTSAVNTVTLCPAVGVTTTITGSINLPLFDVNESSYFIIDGRQDAVGMTRSLTINNTSTASNAGCVRYINGSTNNVLRYINFIGAGTTGTTRIVEFSSSVSNASGNSNNLITRCDINGTRYGIYFLGTVANPNSNNVISYNTMYDGVFSQFFFSSNSSSTTIEHNEIYHTPSIVATGANSMMQVNAGNFGENHISKNVIYDLRNTAALIRGIYLIGAGTASVWNISNNFISMTLDNGTKTTHDAISFAGGNDYTVNLYYNTIRIGGTNGSGGTAGNIVSAGIFKNMSGVGSVFNAKNNIVLNQRTGGNAGVVHTGANYNNLAGTFDVNYNTYWSSGLPVNSKVRWGGTDYNDLPTYKTAVNPQEQNSNFKATNFVSNIDLHLTGASVGDIDLIGTPIVGITTDIDGDIRDVTFPYQGADEGNIPLPVDLASFTATVDKRDVSLNWITTWEVNNDRFEVQRKVKSEDAAWTTIGTVRGAGTTYQMTSYSFTDKNLITGKYEYRLIQFDYNGNSTADYSLNQIVEIGTPSTFALSQNYPNPFNPVTKIAFDIPVESFVKLAIYDMSGKEVAVLVNNVINPGYFVTEFNGASLASGIYFYRLVTNNNVITKKMTLIK